MDFVIMGVVMSKTQNHVNGISIVIENNALGQIFCLL